MSLILSLVCTLPMTNMIPRSDTPPFWIIHGISSYIYSVAVFTTCSVYISVCVRACAWVHIRACINGLIFNLSVLTCYFWVYCCGLLHPLQLSLNLYVFGTNFIVLWLHNLDLDLLHLCNFSFFVNALSNLKVQPEIYSPLLLHFSPFLHLGNISVTISISVLQNLLHPKTYSSTNHYCICTVHVTRSLICQYQHMHNFNVTG